MNAGFRLNFDKIKIIIEYIKIILLSASFFFAQFLFSEAGYSVYKIETINSINKFPNYEVGVALFLIYFVINVLILNYIFTDENEFDWLNKYSFALILTSSIILFIEIIHSGENKNIILALLMFFAFILIFYEIIKEQNIYKMNGFFILLFPFLIYFITSSNIIIKIILLLLFFLKMIYKKKKETIINCITILTMLIISGFFYNYCFDI